MNISYPRLTYASWHIFQLIISRIFLLMCNSSKCVVWLNMPLLKLANIQVILSNFQNCTCCKKYLKYNIHDSPNLAWKYAQIFVLGYYLFLKARSFSWAMLSEKKQIMLADKYPSIFLPQVEVFVYLRSINWYMWMYTYYCVSTDKGILNEMPNIKNRLNWMTTCN